MLSRRPTMDSVHEDVVLVDIDATTEALTIAFGKNHKIDPAEIILLMQNNKNYRLAGPEKLRVSAVMEEVDTRIKTVKTVLRQLQGK